MSIIMYNIRDSLHEHRINIICIYSKHYIITLKVSSNSFRCEAVVDDDINIQSQLIISSQCINLAKCLTFLEKL